MFALKYYVSRGILFINFITFKSNTLVSIVSQTIFIYNFITFFTLTFRVLLLIMTDRKIVFKWFFNGSAPPAKTVITVNFEVNEVRINNASEQKKKVKHTEKLISIENSISSLKVSNIEGFW